MPPTKKRVLCYRCGVELSLREMANNQNRCYVCEDDAERKRVEKWHKVNDTEKY